MNRRLVLATNNQGKVREMKALLAGVYEEVLSLRDEGIVADVVEDGETFMENARKKALEISMLTEADVVADDSGLCVDALGGAPGVYSARYSDPGATDERNNAKLIENLRSVPENERTGRFVCAVVLARHGEAAIEAYGECEGTIILEPRGENGFGYDPLFYVEDYDKTFAELSAEIKNKISHRSRALAQLAEKLSDERK